MSLASRLVRELEENPEEAKRLARIIASEIAGEEQLRSLLLEGLLREAATRRDLEALRRELREEIARVEYSLRREIEALRREMNDRFDRVNERIDRMTRWIIGLLATIWATLAALLIPLVLKLLGA